MLWKVLDYGLDVVIFVVVFSVAVLGLALVPGLPWWGTLARASTAAGFALWLNLNRGGGA